MPLLEREPFLAELRRALREAEAGRGGLLFLGGEAGVGKTTLVGHVREGLAAPARALVGACDPLSTPRPLGPLLDIVEVLGGEVARLVGASAPRDQVFRAFLGALAARTAPPLVVFEDVHWADEATLDLLRFLGRRIGATRTLLVATYRDDEIGPTHPLRIALGDLATAASVRRLALPPLSARAVHTLAEGSDRDPDELYRQTAGNPFFVGEILAGGEGGLPATVRDAVLARAARLSPAGRATLDAAAASGARVEPWLLEQVIGAGAPAAGEAIEAGLLRAEGDVLAFRHELARGAVLGAISPPRLLALHRAILAALRAAPAGAVHAARLAHHAGAAGDRAATLAYATDAAREASRLRAHREAAAQYARALRAADNLDHAQRAELLEGYARECDVSDQLAEGIRAYREAIDARRAVGDWSRQGENLSRLAMQLVMAGRNTEAEEASGAALTLLEPLPPGRPLALAYRTQAHLRMLDRQSAEAVAWGEKAITLAERLEDTELLIRAYNTVGSALLAAGDLSGRGYLERSGALARRLGFADQAVLAFVNLGSTLGEQYQFDLAEHYLGEGIAYGAEHDRERNRLYMIAWQALCRMYRGRWDEATERATQAARRRSSAAVTRIVALVTLGRVRARRGDPEVAAPLDEALALALPTGTLQRVGPVRAARAEAAALAGNWAVVREEAHASFALAAGRGHAWFAGEFGYWLWRAGEPVNLPPLAETPFARQIAGDWAGAAAEWERLGCPYEAARARAEGDDEAALRRALATFEELGARPMAQAVARRLRESGVRAIPRGPRPSTRANAAGLTQREVEIVGLIAADLRNAEIADRLALSPKTVEHHVSAIFAKLGARSRTEAVRLAGQRGLLPQTGGSAVPK